MKTTMMEIRYLRGVMQKRWTKKMTVRISPKVICRSQKKRKRNQKKRKRNQKKKVRKRLK